MDNDLIFGATVWFYSTARTCGSECVMRQICSPLTSTAGSVQRTCIEPPSKTRCLARLLFDPLGFTAPEASSNSVIHISNCIQGIDDCA